MSVLSVPQASRRQLTEATQDRQPATGEACKLVLAAEERELLAWVARQPRTYAEAMTVWQTSCPRHSVWEDVMGAALIEVETRRGMPMEQAAVRLTAAGRAVLGDA